ncbi:MAG: transglycosylase domain-containing protein [Saprospiraceae bacterium]|nr:transglycosylase domain-containing protein [Saprospiraceae bacterium]
MRLSVFQTCPVFQDLENPKYDLASVIYDVKGTPFGRYYIEDRIAVEYAQISENVKNALLVTEDERFYNHNGIDLRALARGWFYDTYIETGECRWWQYYHPTAGQTPVQKTGYEEYVHY